MNGPLALGFISIPTATGAHLQSITTMALFTFCIAKKVLPRMILWLWLLMDYLPSHSFVSWKLSSPSSCKAGMLMILLWLVPGIFSPIIFIALPSLVQPMAIFPRPPRAFLLFHPPTRLQPRSFSPPLAYQCALDTTILVHLWVTLTSLTLGSSLKW